VNNLPKVQRDAPQPGIEPATSRLQVRRPTLPCHTHPFTVILLTTNGYIIAKASSAVCGQRRMIRHNNNIIRNVYGAVIMTRVHLVQHKAAGNPQIKSTNYDCESACRLL